jgi:thiol-disulfide isomerase/thioredoxin
MRITLLVLFLILASCSKQELSLNGIWEIQLKLQDETLPVLLDLKQNKDTLSGFLLNSSERIPLTGKIENNTYELEIGSHYAVLRGELSREGLSGNWIRTNKDNYKVGYSGNKVAKNSLYEKYEQVDSLINIEGKWKIQLTSEKLGMGLFKQKGSRIQGSILTNTGDYRFLDGFIEQDKVLLTGFDGVFSFVIKMIISNEKLKATLYSGNSYKADITGIKDDKFQLKDPNSITEIKGDRKVSLDLNDIFGNKISLNNNNIKVIQLFGSWCPNCIDETHFILDWKKNRPEKASQVDFIALAFERTTSKKEAMINLKKVSKKLKMNYPIALIDFDKSVSVNTVLPIEKINAFPTTIFLNRKNEIVKIHTGFSGQATQDVFEDFQRDFNLMIDSLIK